MIKIRLRRNLIYIITLYLSYFIRKIISIVIDIVFHLNAPYIYLYMMTLGEAIGGFTIYYYHRSNWKQKKQAKYFGLQLIYNKVRNITGDGKFKQIVLIFFAGFFDFFEFVLVVLYVPKIAGISPTAKTRLGCLATITSSLICVYALGFKIGRHQKCSLISLSICFIVTFILEIIFKPDDQPMGRYIFAHFLIFIFLAYISSNDCTERYLAFYNYLNPFLILMVEGIFEIIMSIFISIGNDPFKGIIDAYNKINAGKFVLLIFLLIIYFLLSAITNIYKVYCNVIYTPMARSLTEYFLNPIINIYYFLVEKDFNNNYIYFFICEIICIITDISFYVFNEYLILSFFGLEHDTREAIHRRSIAFEKNGSDYYIGCEDEEEEEDEENVN